MKEVIILGTGNSAQYCRWDCEVWGVNGAYAFRHRFAPDTKLKFRLDKLFLADNLFAPDGRLNFNIDVMNSLIEEYGTEIISMYPLKLGKHKLKYKPYPYANISKHFGSEYFTSTICYMMAYALYKRYDHLRLYGVDMASKQEYVLAKGGVEFWVGYALGLGCTIDIATGSTITMPKEGYPYNRPPKVNLKNIDPFGLLKGRNPSSAEQDKISQQINRQG